MAASQYCSALDAVLPVAARVGYQFTEADVVASARAAGISPTHALYVDRRELYHEALRYAHALIWPEWSPDEETALEKMIPADAVRRFVEVTVRRFREHPDAVRLIVAENMFDRCNLSSAVGILEDSPVVLMIDRMLMHGHDVGAFRTGVSAEDIFVLLTALCAFPLTQGHAFYALYGMDIADARNSVGMTLMASDAVLAFLSTTMDTTQGASYTHSSLSHAIGSSVAASLYSSEDYYSDENFGCF